MDPISQKETSRKIERLNFDEYSNLEKELLEGLPANDPDMPCYPLGCGSQELNRNPKQYNATILSTQYFCEETMKPETVGKNARLEAYLISCLAPNQFAHSTREFISEEVISETPRKPEEEEPEEESVCCLNHSMGREEIDQEERKTAALMMKVMNLRINKLIHKVDEGDNMQNVFRECRESGKKLLEEERRQIFEELKNRVEELERKIEEVSIETLYESTDPLKSNNESFLKEKENLLNQCNTILGVMDSGTLKSNAMEELIFKLFNKLKKLSLQKAI